MKRLLPILFAIFFLLSNVKAFEDNTEGNRNHDPHHCSVFTLAKGEQVFFGGNDDFINPDSYYWVELGDSSSYGVIWIGEPDNIQQGINEKGLVYDANGLPRVDVNPHNERLPVPGGYTSYYMHILYKCATVEEVIDWVNTHERYPFMHEQLHFADPTGDAVIVSAGKDGEMVFTLKDPGDGFLISTNFNVANPANGFGYPCWRYDRATEMLGELVDKEGSLSVPEVAAVLDAIHVETATGWTLYSFFADLTNGVIYIYYFYQFDDPVLINVAGELANPREPGPLSMLFPEDVRTEAEARYQALQKLSGRCRIFGLIWLGFVFFSLVMYLILLRPGKREIRFWIPVMFVLGPVAFLLRSLATPGEKKSNLKDAVMESAGDVMPSVFVFLIVLLVLLVNPAFQNNWTLQLISFLVIPPLMSWLLFHGLFLKTLLAGRYGSNFGRRILHSFIATNISLAGISMVAMPGINLSLQFCSVLPFSGWTPLVFWLMIALGTVPGGLLLFIYERWAVRRNFRAWSLTYIREGSLSTPSFRKAWWWLLVSYALLILGIAAGASIQ